MPFNAVRHLIEPDLKAVNHLITDYLHSDVDLINTISQHIIHSGGKRIRPILVLLSANVFACQGERPQTLAAIIEFIHTATLLHDDVVDSSALRRGRETANAVWGNQASVLVGDFLYSRAFQLMVSLQNMRVMNILANTTNLISEGEVLQLLNVQNASVSEESYFTVIRCKTAELFRAATQLGAVIAERSETEIQALADYGLHLGLAYQLIDDVLDYSADSETLGKNIGDDLAEGKPTLPLIYALQHGNSEQQSLIQHAIENASKENLAAIQCAIIDTGALDYVRGLAQREVDLALQAIADLPVSSYQTALVSLAKFAVERES